MTTIGALIITHNEAENIEGCLRSLAFCDERVVVDSFSEDDTVARAGPLADRIYRREFRGHANQKNWGMQQLRSDWFLLIDADERVPEALSRELRELSIAEDCGAYWIHRRTAFFGRWIRGAGWQRDRVLRFLRRGTGEYPETHVHEEITCTAGTKIGRCHHRLLHYSYDAWEPTFDRLLAYSSAGAKERARRGQSFSIRRVVTVPFARFVGQYFFRAGFRDGIHGLALCTWSAIGVFLRELKGQLGETAYAHDPPALDRSPRVEIVDDGGNESIENSDENPPTERTS